MRNRYGGNLSLPRAAEHGVHSNSNSGPELQLWPSTHLQCRVHVMHVASHDTSFRSLFGHVLSLQGTFACNWLRKQQSRSGLSSAKLNTQYCAFRKMISAVTVPCSATGELADVVAQLRLAAGWGDHHQHHRVDAPVAGRCAVWQLQRPAAGAWRSIIRSTSCGELSSGFQSDPLVRSNAR